MKVHKNIGMIMGFKLILLITIIGLIINTDAKINACTDKVCKPDPADYFDSWEFTEDRDTLYVDMKEESKIPTEIVIINCASCDGILHIPSIDVSSDPYLLEYKIIHLSDTQYMFQIENRQDYENENQRKYIFSIIMPGSKNIRCLLNIIDIDDVKPTIIPIDAPCIITENEDGKSNCTFKVYDPDSTTIRYEIENYDDIFSITEDNLNPNPVKPVDEVVRLLILKALDFETQPMYSFNILVFDNAGNKGSALVIIKVKDVSDMPPVWINIFATKTFEEHDTTQVYTVLAKDGDIEVNAPIKYRFDDVGCHKEITVSEDKGEITIGNIDRDYPEIVDNTIKCKIIAYEVDNSTSSDIIFIVQDINDNKPIITLSDPEICMNEGEMMQFDNIFSVNDIDQGANAQYDVKIFNDGKYAKAFQVIPSSGYREWDFSISVLDPKYLDYEDKDWRNFELTIHAIDKGNPVQEYKEKINVCLYNMNNNAPVFKTKIFEVKIPENAKKDTQIIIIEAEDKDTDDWVTYEITMGKDKFEKKGGTNKDPITVYPIKDNVFDYEKQTEVFFQITINDNLNSSEGIMHKVSQQVTIIVTDINDEKPRITILSTETPEVKEHSQNYEIKDVFEAEDVDTDAELIFEILWDETYGMKEGVKKTDKKLFENVFKIVPVYETLANGKINYGKATASLVVSDASKLDWEEFEILYLKIQVEDKKQVENKPGIDIATMAIIIEDINDSPPVLNPISDTFRVIEEAAGDTYIGKVLATDKDGPGNNEILYELIPTDGTKDGLIKIDENTGEISVDGNGKIDADLPEPTFDLTYMVVAKDPNIVQFKDSKELTIAIDDINNKSPRLTKDMESVDFLEGETSPVGDPITEVKATDDDRDEPHNTLIYEINGERNIQLIDYFDIGNSGRVFVSKPLVWKRDQQSIQVDILVKDNKGLAGYLDLKTSFTLNIIDVDNNKPQLSSNANLKEISEATGKETIFGKITATDDDKPCTSATEIDYKIIKIMKILEDSSYEDIDDDIFRIDTHVDEDDKNCVYYGNLITNKELIGYFGKVRITVTATNPVPENVDKKDYDFEITPFNFRDPSIINPPNSKIVLRTNQKVDDTLIQIDSNGLQDFIATDNQNDKFLMTFSLETIQGQDIFKFKATGKSAAQLQLKNLPDPEEIIYKIKVTASHSGTGNSKNEVDKTYDIYFLDVNQLPFFDKTEANLEIEENDKIFCGDFPEAIDPKCSSVDTRANCIFTTYYHILSKTEFFHIPDPAKPTLCVKQPLDYETQTLHELTIVSNNDKDQPPLDPKSPLKLTINVIDVNDNPPVFDIKPYIGGISSGLQINSEILTVHATDIDTVDTELKYKIDETSIQISDKSLESAKNTPFIIDSATGLIRNNFSPVVDMKGYILFEVQVFDSGDLHNDTTEVKISIITDENKIAFTFNNDVDFVKSRSLNISQIFSNELQYNCSIDGINKKTEAGVVINDQTEVTTHFVNRENSEPVPEANITAKTDIDMISRLSLRFEDIGLELSGIKKNVEEEIQNMENQLRIILIVVSVVLSALIIILIIAFVLRTRSLNKRLESMTTNIFGSTKSDLNRIGTSAPGTNKHAVEANPVWNTDMNNGTQFDSISQTSGGSDLIGIEDNPEFQYSSNKRRDSINPMYHNKMANTSFENEDDDIHSLPGSNI